MSNAFYLPKEEWQDKAKGDAKTTVIIRGPEVAHAHASRLRHGESVLLFDGAGAKAECEVLHLGKKKLELAINNIIRVSKPVSRAIMAIAVSKAARRGFFMEKASELGAWEIWLWHAERSQWEISENLLESSRNKVIAGGKQSQNPWFPQIRSYSNVHELIKGAGAITRKILPWEHQGGLPMLTEEQLGHPGETIYVIGPEGGFTDNEVQSLKDAAFQTVSLGSNILRCETAATLCLGLHWWASCLHGNKSAPENPISPNYIEKIF